MTRETIGQPSPQDIDFDTLYEPVIIVGWNSVKGRQLREEIEVNDEVTRELREMGVADAIVALAAGYWPASHDGAQMDRDGIRFGFSCSRDERESPSLDYNT